MLTRRDLDAEAKTEIQNVLLRAMISHKLFPHFEALEQIREMRFFLCDDPI